MRAPIYLGLLLSLSATAAVAQTAQAGRQIDGVAWYVVRYTKFKPGMADEARKLAYDHFWPVDKEIGRDVIPFDYVTGEWDHVVYFPMPDGPGELAFQETALGKKWYDTLVRREGGQAGAQAVMKRFGEMVLHEKTEVVRRRVR
jgi:hypothetical protein